MKTVPAPAEIYRVSYSREEICGCFDNLRNEICQGGNVPQTRYVCLGKDIVRILIYDPRFMPAIQTYFGYTLREDSDSYLSTIVLWKTEGEMGRSDKLYHIVNRDSDPTRPVMIFYRGVANGYDESADTYYCGFPDYSIESMIQSGDIFVKPFYKILKGRSGALVHGACVGVDGKGVMICARGGKGKSTLAVSSMLKGFDYVADDYQVIDVEDGCLTASPIYSVIKLSHGMYGMMHDEIGDAPIVAENPRGDKHVVDVSKWHSQFRSGYPVRLCLMPELDLEADEPEVTPCTKEERGQGMIHIVHSTIKQHGDMYDNSGSAKLLNLLRDQKFYKIRLCRDIYRNVECLRSFLQTLDD